MKNLITDVKITTKDLLARKGRSFLTTLGIIIGVAGVIIIISLGKGAQSLVLDQVTKLGSNIVGVLPGNAGDKGPPTSVFGVQIKTLVYRDVLALRNHNNVPDAVEVSPVVRGNVTVVGSQGSVDTSFTATEANYAKIHNLTTTQGSFFSKEQGQTGANVIVLGTEVANSLFPNSGALGKVVKIKIPNNNPATDRETPSIPFRVIGIQKEMGTVAFQNMDDQVYIPFSIGQRQILGINYIQFIHIGINNGNNVQPSIQDIRKTIRSNHKIKNSSDDDFTVRGLTDAIKVLTNITNSLSLFLGFMAGLSLIVGGIGIMNIMLVTVSERTREIGLRKAIGATNRNIKNQFLRESIILTFAGGILGIVLGVLVSYLITLVAHFLGYSWAFIISPLSIILSILVAVAIGIIFGLYPAMKASKLDPIVALRYE